MDRNARPLNEVVQNCLLPTPQAHDRAGAKTPEQIAAMRARGHGVANLNETAAQLLNGHPTGSGAPPERSAPTKQPSASTNAPSDGGLLPLWNLDGTENPA
jgi:hypothetical protein